MKLKVFTLRLDETTGAFDDRELRAFVEDQDQPREILDVSEHFFLHEGRPIWALLLRYRDIPQPGACREQHLRKDWRADLDGPDQERPWS